MCSGEVDLIVNILAINTFTTDILLSWSLSDLIRITLFAFCPFCFLFFGGIVVFPDTTFSLCALSFRQLV